MKTNRGFAWVPVLIVIVLAGGAWWLYSRSQTPSENQPPTENQGTTIATGEVYFSITDAVADMGAVTAVDMTVSKVELQSATEGWVTASSETKTYSLLELKAKGESALMAVADIKVGTYNQIQVTVDKVEITAKDGKKSVAKVPSNEIKMMSDVVVTEGASSSVNLDFLADASLHITGKGSYIFTPVVKVDSRSQADVMVGMGDSGDVVTVGGGNVNANATFGMDVSGEVRRDFKLDPKAKLDIDASDAIKINGVVVPPVGVQGGPTGTSNEQNSPSTGGGTGAGAEVKTGI